MLFHPLGAFDNLSVLNLPNNKKHNIRHETNKPVKVQKKILKLKNSSQKDNFIFIEGKLN